MMEGLDDNEIDQYLEENPKIIPLFEVDVFEIITPYVNSEGIRLDNHEQQPDPKSLIELRHQ